MALEEAGVFEAVKSPKHAFSRSLSAVKAANLVATHISHSRNAPTSRPDPKVDLAKSPLRQFPKTKTFQLSGHGINNVSSIPGSGNSVFPPLAGFPSPDKKYGPPTDVLDANGVQFLPPCYHLPVRKRAVSLTHPPLLLP